VQQAFKFIVLLFLNLSCAIAMAQKAGDSAGAFICAGENDAHLLDLFESEISGHPIAYDNVTDIETQVTAALDKLQTVHPDLALHAREDWQIIQSHQAGGPDVAINPPADSGKASKAGCDLKGMMYFDDSRNALIRNTTIFNAQKTKTQFAASYVHEAIYKALRDRGVEAGKGTVTTRLLVGCLFTKDDLGQCLNLQPNKPATAKDAWTCDVTAKNVKINFTIFNYEPVLSWQVRVNSVNGVAVAFKNQMEYLTTDSAIGNPSAPVEITELGEWGSYGGGLPGLESLGTLLGQTMPYVNVTRAKPLTVTVAREKQKFVCRK
jgi:hypothetical protein